MSRAAGRAVAPRLIPFGRDAAEQREILETIATAVPNGEVSFDLTHGFRHLGMVGFLSAFILGRVGN
jgi:CRISPR-associated DxTHG motif protein